MIAPRILSLSLAALLLAGFAAAPTADAQVKATPAIIGLAKGGNPQGYIRGSNEQGVLFSTTESQQGRQIAYSEIRGEGLDKAIRLDERNELLRGPRALFADGLYEEAAVAFGNVARDYRIVLGIPRNFALEAFFYQIESLRRAGKFSQMAPLVDSAAAKTIVAKLGDDYRERHAMHKLWGLLGAGKMEELKSALESYQQPVVGEASLLRSPLFREMPPTRMVQVAFLRAKVLEAADEKDAALDDYYRVFTLTNANDPILGKLAMRAAIDLQMELTDPGNEANEIARKQMQGLVYTFAKLHGEESVPDEAKPFATRPEMRQPTPVAEEGVEEKPAEGEEGGGEKKADAEKEGEEGEKKEEGGDKEKAEE